MTVLDRGVERMGLDLHLIIVLFAEQVHDVQLAEAK